MPVWAYALLSVALVSAIPLVVVPFFPRDPRRMRRLVRGLVSFAVGAMLGSAVLDLLPEANARLGDRTAAPLILIGFVAFFALEKLVRAHAHLAGEGEAHQVQPMAVLNLVGDAVHNAVDGMAIAATYLASTSLGVATTVAVVLHEIPQELGDYGVLVFGGFTFRRAVLYNVLTALTAFAGAGVVLVVGAHVAGLAAWLLPVAAGSFIYIAAADLVPALHREHRWAHDLLQIALIVLGMALLYVPILLGAG